MTSGRFCERCGSPLLSPEAQFCGTCGTRQPVSPPTQATSIPGWPPPPVGAPPVGAPPPAPLARPPYAPAPPPAPLVPTGPQWAPPRASTPKRGGAYKAIVALVLVALVGAAVVGGAMLADGDRTLGAGASAGPQGTDTGSGAIGPVGETPAVPAGPDLGETWTTAPDPSTFVVLDDGTPVASGQYLVSLADGSSASDAGRIAATVGGDVAGHIAYLDLWKIAVEPTVDGDAWAGRLATLAAQPGVLLAAPVNLVVAQAGPDCAPALGDKVYAGNNAKPYDMIGVRSAWEAYYASGLPKSDVHLGMIDTALTHDPKGRIKWEFSNTTFIGEPATEASPRAATADDPSEDGFRHADGTLGLIAGDPSNGGIAGIASPLGSGLAVSHSVLGSGVEKGAPEKWESVDGYTYTDATLLNTIRQIESGATIINGSWGGASVTGQNAGAAAMWSKFYAKMAKDHPDVLFVFAAGNYGSPLDGTNYFPGGIPAANVITVGNVNTDGTRNETSNESGTGGEVTLGAPGNNAVWGKGVDGQVLAANGGTSSATPMVAATAALIRAVDPKLTAAEIKDLIAGSAGAGPADVGGRTLRSDLAVRKAIDGARAKAGLPPLTDEVIAASKQLCEVNVTGDMLRRLERPAGATEWSIKASLRNARGPTFLTLVLGGARPSNWRQAVAGSGQAVGWTVAATGAGTSIIVTRLDNGFWVKYTLRDPKPAASPKPTAKPTARPKPTAKPKPTPGVDCSHPPPGSKTSIKYIEWSLHCQQIGP